MVNNWLKPYHTKFISAWTNRTINYHQTTTNRAESQHAAFKKYIQNNRNTLVKLAEFVDQLVTKQHTLILGSFEESRKKVMNHHKSCPMLKSMFGYVSIYAIEKIYKELQERKASMRTYGATCGCQLFTSCGLPCACRLEKLENEGKKIILTSIDKLWTKLDFKPVSKKQLEFDLDAEFEKLKKIFRPHTTEVKKNMFERMIQAITPGKSQKKPPVVQQNTRGRPTLKVQEQRRQETARTYEAPRHSSYVPSQQSTYGSPYEDPRHSSYLSSQQSTYGFPYEDPRHSSYTPSEDFKRPSRVTKPVKQRSRSTSTQPQSDHGFPLIHGGTDLYTINKYKIHIPEMFHPYVSVIKNVNPDGHCGFRATALGLGWEEKDFRDVRRQLVDEMVRNQSMWFPIFESMEEGRYQSLLDCIDFDSLEMAPEEHWMDMPDTGLLIAERFGVIVHTLDTRGSDTSFPITKGPNDVVFPHRCVTLVYLEGSRHFIHVKLDGQYPMPTPNFLWTRVHQNAAAGWLTVYEHRLEMYRSRLNPTIDLNTYDIPDSSHDNSNVNI